MADSVRGPVLIEMGAETAVSPDAAPPVPEALDAPTGQAMQMAAVLAARRGSPVGRLFWSLLFGFFGFVLSLAAWDYVNALLARNEVLGAVAMALLVGLLLTAAVVALREISAFARLRSVAAIHTAAGAAILGADLSAARGVADRLAALYAPRPDLRWGLERLADRRADAFDADGLLGLAERELMAPLDQAARREVEGAVRQVATVTAFVPVALADVAAVLIANLRMIRRIAEIYGGRAGTLGSWRLTRNVLTHLVASGAVAVGDDLIQSVAGGGLLSKLSRRFGEGVVNGALTARVGVAAMEVCRPLPFRALPKPRVTNLVQRALTGLFGRET